MHSPPQSPGHDPTTTRAHHHEHVGPTFPRSKNPTAFPFRLTLLLSCSSLVFLRSVARLTFTLISWHFSAFRYDSSELTIEWEPRVHSRAHISIFFSRGEVVWRRRNSGFCVCVRERRGWDWGLDIPLSLARGIRSSGVRRYAPSA